MKTFLKVWCGLMTFTGLLFAAALLPPFPWDAVVFVTVVVTVLAYSLAKLINT